MPSFHTRQERLRRPLKTLEISSEIDLPLCEWRRQAEAKSNNGAQPWNSNSRPSSAPLHVYLLCLASSLTSEIIIMIRITQLLILFTLWSLSNAGFMPPAELCLPSSHLKELSGCIAMTKKEDECAAKETKDEKLDCYCTQEMLSSIFAYVYLPPSSTPQPDLRTSSIANLLTLLSCQDDVRRCLESHMFDAQFDSRVRRWHSTCDSRLPSTTSLTTPPVTSLTATYDFGACNRLYQSCASADYETNKCSQTWMPTSGLSYVSCACHPPVYSLFSECQYNGNISCALRLRRAISWGILFARTFGAGR